MFAISMVLLASLLTGTSSSTAAICPPPAADGKTIGKVIVGKTTVDVKNVDYPAGQDLNPPKSPLNVGLSIRHKQLSATEGSSILVWHINYNGCKGKLDVINKEKVGFKFSVVDESGKKTQYAITSRLIVPKGQYQSEWFLLSGPRKLVLITCTGKVVNRHYLDNLVIIASPVQTI